MSVVKIQRQVSWTGTMETDPLILPEQSDTKKSWRCSRQTVRNLITFIALWIAYLVINVAYSILDPFYPQEVNVIIAVYYKYIHTVLQKLIGGN